MTNSYSQPELFQPWNDACERWLLNQATNLEQLFSEDKEKQDNRDEEMRIADIALNGFISTMAIFGAIEIGLFETLQSGPYQLDALAQQLKVQKTNLYRLLLTLQRIGLVKLISSEYVLQTPARRFFTPTAQEFEPYLWTRLSMTRIFLQKYVTQWADMVRGQRQFDELEWPPHDEQAFRHFESIMIAEVPYLAARLKPIIQEKSTKRLLDVGGNGAIASLLAVQQPDLNVTVLNWPHAGSFIAEIVEKFKVAEQVRPYLADFLEDSFPTHYDAVLFSRVLINWPDEVVSRLLSKTYQALDSEKGRIIIYEHKGNIKEGVNHIWLTFMAMGINAQVFGRTPLRWIDLLDQAGFHNPRLQNDGNEKGYRVIQAFIGHELNEIEQLRPSQTIYHNGDTVRITLPPLSKGQTQYVGIKVPAGGQTFVVNQFNSLQPFNGMNLFPWQGDETVIEQVVLPNLPRGKYLLYLLQAPEGVSALSPSGQWILNVSTFRIK